MASLPLSKNHNGIVAVVSFSMIRTTAICARYAASNTIIILDSCMDFLRKTLSDSSCTFFRNSLLDFSTSLANVSSYSAINRFAIASFRSAVSSLLPARARTAAALSSISFPRFSVFSISAFSLPFSRKTMSLPLYLSSCSV